jgi:phosphohistidine phosphatase
MVLYLVRHADARKEEEDPLRALSEKGISDITRIASCVRQLNPHALRIFHSPKLRARQTAEILSEYLNPVKGPSEVDGLSPLDHPDIWAVRIQNTYDDTILVGHLPHLGRLASLLLCGNLAKNVIAFRTASITCLKRDDAGLWSLAWMLTPEILLGEQGTGYTCDSL